MIVIVNLFVYHCVKIRPGGQIPSWVAGFFAANKTTETMDLGGARGQIRQPKPLISIPSDLANLSDDRNFRSDPTSRASHG